jgi:hypothetical protein
MGLIREPEGVDLLIQSKPLTKSEERALSKFIREYKEKRKSKPAKKKAIRRVAAKAKDTSS